MVARGCCFSSGGSQADCWVVAVGREGERLRGGSWRAARRRAILRRRDPPLGRGKGVVWRRVGRSCRTLAPVMGGEFCRIGVMVPEDWLPTSAVLASCGCIIGVMRSEVLASWVSWCSFRCCGGWSACDRERILVFNLVVWWEVFGEVGEGKCNMLSKVGTLLYGVGRWRIFVNLALAYVSSVFTLEAFVSSLRFLGLCYCFVGFLFLCVCRCMH